MSRNELLWLVGLLEGEGSFVWTRVESKKGNQYFSPLFQLTMTDPDVIAHAAKILGCGSSRPYFRKPPKLPIYCIVLSGERAINLMKQLYPHMGARRQATIKWVCQNWRDKQKTKREEKKNG